MSEDRSVLANINIVYMTDMAEGPDFMFDRFGPNVTAQHNSRKDKP